MVIENQKKMKIWK